MRVSLFTLRKYPPLPQGSICRQKFITRSFLLKKRCGPKSILLPLKSYVAEMPPILSDASRTQALISAFLLEISYAAVTPAGPAPIIIAFFIIKNICQYKITVYLKHVVIRRLFLQGRAYPSVRQIPHKKHIPKVQNQACH